MKTEILDTNVLIRFLVGDEVRQQAQARQWFKEAERGQRSIVITPVVIAETTFVLESFYKQSRDRIADALEVFIGQRWLKIDDRDVLITLWRYYRTKLHFVGSYLRAWADLHDADILSFDKKLLQSGRRQ